MVVNYDLYYETKKPVSTTGSIKVLLHCLYLLHASASRNSLAYRCIALVLHIAAS